MPTTGVTLNGRPYVMDLSKFKRGLPTPLRQSFNSSEEPGDGAIATSAVWRRTQVDFSDGSGERFFDPTRDSNRNSFHESLGIDPWQKGYLKLLPETTLHSSNIAASGDLVQAGKYIVWASGTANFINVYDPGTGVTTGYDMSSAVSRIAADGEVVYVACAAALKKFVISTTTTSSIVATVHDFVAVVHGRLIAGNGVNLFEYSAAGAVVTTFTLATIPTTTGWFWRCAAAVPGFIIIGGGGGVTGTNPFGGIYRIEFDATTGALKTPLFPATDLPATERPNRMLYYGQFLALGTTAGLRLAVIDSSGSITYGDPLGTHDSGNRQPGNVFGLFATGKFLYFGWNTYDASNSGVGRADLSNFWRGPLSPAYASDVMAPVQGVAVGIGMVGTQIWFSLAIPGAGVGVYKTTGNKVATGVLYTGEIHYGFLAAKVAIDLDVRHDALPAGATVHATVYPIEATTGTGVGTDSATGSYAPVPPWDCLNLVSDAFYLAFTMTRATDITVGPALRRWVFRSAVVPRRFEQIIAPLILHSVVDAGGAETQLDPWTEYNAILTAAKAGIPVPFVNGGHTNQVWIESVELDNATHWSTSPTTGDQDFFEHMLIVTMDCVT